MIPLFPSGIDQRDHSRCARDCKVYFQKFNVGNRLRRMRASRSGCVTGFPEPRPPKAPL
jgi:hypothetical protein